MMDVVVKPEEIAWARAIRDAARNDPNISHDEISDLEYIQNAIIAKSNTSSALKRIQRLQAFKERYHIDRGDGSLEQGLREFRHFRRLFPNFYAGMGVRKDGVRVLCYDFSQYKVSKLNSQESYMMTMRSFFYVLQATNSNLQAMRDGVVGLLDVSHAGRQNLSIEQEKRAAQLFANSYPMQTKQVIVLGASGWIRWLYSFVQKFVVRKYQGQKELPYHFPSRDEYLDMAHGLFTKENLPQGPYWGGSQTPQDVEAQFELRLKERYENRANFSCFLDDNDDEEPCSSSGVQIEYAPGIHPMRDDCHSKKIPAFSSDISTVLTAASTSTTTGRQSSVGSKSTL